jgi:phosphatidylinositol alpha-1,6-mannosyltransferase
MADVLFVSKTVEPPWNDSSKNLVRDIASELTRYTPTLMGRSSGPSPLGLGSVVDVYGKGGAPAFSPSIRDKLGVLSYLLWGTHADLWHFFFAPNPKSSVAGRFATALRRTPSVHTVCSLPERDAPLGRLVFADLTVVLSRYAHERFCAEGLDESALRIIPPSVPALREPGESERAALRAKHGLPASASIWIYPGDLEHGGGAEVSIDGFAAAMDEDACLLMACRNKSAGAEPERVRLMEQARRKGIERRVRWVGETLAIHELLALSDFVVLPNTSGFAKMDYPLVALEAMAMGRAVLVSSRTAAAELAAEGGALAIEPVPEALASAVETLSSDAARTKTLGQAARRLTQERFSPKRIADAYERIYGELLA